MRCSDFKIGDKVIAEMGNLKFVSRIKFIMRHTIVLEKYLWYCFEKNGVVYSECFGGEPLKLYNTFI